MRIWNMVFVVLLAAGCAQNPETGVVLRTGEGLPGVELTGQKAGDAARVGDVAPTECAWRSEWVQVWSELVDHRFAAPLDDDSGGAVVFGAAEHPDQGWFAFDVAADGQSLETFWDDTRYWEAPRVLRHEGDYLMAGTRDAKHLNVQRRAADGAAIWTAELRLPEGAHGYTVLSAHVLQVVGEDLLIAGVLDSTSCCSPIVMAARVALEDGSVRFLRVYEDTMPGARDEAFEYP
ncbi:MAG: hypothetical protein ACI8PZ_007521, partial [Myxococcota bacterium]